MNSNYDVVAEMEFSKLGMFNIKKEHKYFDFIVLCIKIMAGDLMINCISSI